MPNVSMSMIEWIGTSALAIGLLVLLFSPYRRWLGFMLAGMFYFIFLEATRLVTHYSLGFGLFEGYIAGVALSVTGLAVWLGVTEDQRDARRTAERLARQIEHRPVHMKEIETL
jgi:hypothetical protein